MKRFVCAALFCVISCTATACGKTGDAGTVSVNLAEPFSMEAEFTCGDLTGAAGISHGGTEVWDATFTAPDSLAGVTLSYLDGNVTASYKGLTFSVPQSAVPVKASLGQLFTVLEQAGKDGSLDCIKKDGFCVIEGSLDAGTYTLTLEENGAPAAFSMPNLKLEMSFQNFASGSGNTGTGTTAPTTETTAAASSTDQKATTVAQ